MGILQSILGTRVEDRPIHAELSWDPGKKVKLISYNQAIKMIRSGEKKQMVEAIVRNILNAPRAYAEISKALPASQENLLSLLVPLLKHPEYEVRCSIPAILAGIGDRQVIPALREVVRDDPDLQVVRNANIAIDALNKG